MCSAAFRSTLHTPHLDRLTEFVPAISTAEAQSLVVLGAQHLTDRRPLARFVSSPPDTKVEKGAS